MPSPTRDPAASDAADQAVQQLADQVADKLWWKSRTLIVNAAVLGLAAAEAQLQVLQPLLRIDVYQLLAFALPVVNAVLRVMTSQPIAGTGPKA